MVDQIDLHSSVGSASNALTLITPLHPSSRGCFCVCCRRHQVKRTTKVKVFTEQTRVHKSCLERTKWKKFGLAQVSFVLSVLKVECWVVNW